MTSLKGSLYQEDSRPLSEGRTVLEDGGAYNREQHNCFWYLLVAQFYRPEDSFSDRLRKGFIGLNLVPLSIIAISFALFGMTRAENATHFAVDISNLLQGIFCIVNYLIMRRTSAVSETQIGIVMWILAVNMSVTYIGSPDFDNKAVVFGVVFLCVALQHPHFNIIIVLLVLQGLIIDWNGAWDDESGMRAALPGHKVYPPGVLKFAINVVGSIILASMTLVFHSIVKETQKKEVAQTKANEMTLDILRCQRKYDTDTVDAILDDRAKEGQVDAELITLFRAMNKNLLAYKPFLPNYLFLSDEEDEEGELGAEDSSTAFSPGVSGTEKDRVQPFKSRGVRRGGDLNRSCQDSEMGDGRSLSSFTNDVGSVVSRGSSKHTGGIKPTLQRGLGGQRGALFKGRVSFAMLDLTIPGIFSNVQSAASAVPPQTSSSSIAPTDTSAIAEGLAVVVNSVYSLAQETRASVHSMLGDRVQLTWNATNPVTQAETKAAHFMCRLAGKLKSLNSSPTSVLVRGSSAAPERITVAGFVCSGPAAVHSITSTTKQQAMIIHMTSLSLLEAGLQLARKHRTVLMDEVTRRCSTLEILSFPVEKAQYLPNNHPTNTTAGCSFTYHQSVRSLADDGYDAEPLSVPSSVLLNGTQKPLPSLPTPATPQESGIAAAGVTSPQSTSDEDLRRVKLSYIHEIVAEKQRAEDEWMYQLQGEEFLLEGGGNINDPFEVSSCTGPTDVKAPAQGFAFLLKLISEGKYETALSLYNSCFSSAASSTGSINGGPVVFQPGSAVDGSNCMEASSSTRGAGGGQHCFPSQSFMKEAAAFCRQHQHQ